MPFQDPLEDGVAWNDNGLIKISGQNQPWKYFEFASGTDCRYVYETIKPWLADDYNVACMGYYGESDSSHNRAICCISTVGGNLKFLNHNDTVYLTINASSEYGWAALNGKLAILVLSI